MTTPVPARPLAAIVAIAATYVFFLLFAEFGLLHLMEAASPEPAVLRAGLALLGAGGVCGSLLAAFVTTRRVQREIAFGFLGCATAATLAALGGTPLSIVAGLTGLALGWLTVRLAGNLHVLLAGAPLGLCTGAGTGLAYACCNLPPVFASSAIGHAWIGAAACVLGALAAPLLATDNPAPDPAGVAEALRFRAEREPFRYDTSTGRSTTFWLLLAALVALVWLDSAAFLLIQERPALRALTWATAPQLWANAAVHLAAALLAGWLLDRGLLRFTLALAGADLLVASFALAHGGAAAARLHPLYPAGVSLYSTALVALPALARAWPGHENTHRRAAALYVLAGWIGSALGIGMALDQRTIPTAFLVAAGVALAVLLCTARIRTAAVALLLCGALPNRSFAAPNEEAAQIAVGRAVYIAEGCIHCHSQFIRPGTPDTEYWGPARPLAEMLQEAPPLPGNRRQGPDLQNVGNRRSPDWNRLHLQDPRALAPGSTMPRYAHLFVAGDPRGEALVAYLASLGADTTEARARQIAAWTPTPLAGDAQSGATLFASLCASCHGADGRGRGLLAEKLAAPPADLATGPRPRTTCATPEATAAELARVIRFGVPGTAMAGHETLPAADLAALTSFLSKR